MSGPDGIDWAWAQRTSGNLDRRQKLQLSATLARSLPAFTLSAVRTRVGLRGSGSLDFAAARVDELLQRHPRLGLKKHMAAAWLDESKAVPNGRAN
ncbi:hypothetical protein [Antrihabitans spumae]|uniref:Uncharacterized protein n=1 Tax=Antrihabitans spumae TaxID=3373370 RepID=A0ABW7K4H7_9NOCA